MSVEKLWDEPQGMNADGRALIGLGGVKPTDPSQTANGCVRRTWESDCE